ncbi:MAG TPA: DinB family protein [bacterium]|nr:DinB family protein [bacterium]
MTTREVILRSHAIVHGLEVGQAEGQFSLEYSRLNGVTDDQLRLRPQGWNSIAYLLWHMARCEDVAANVIVAQRPQVFDEGEWSGRLRITRRDIGTGMTDEEVEALSRAIDLPNLRAYRGAVGRRTQDIARELPDPEWDQTVDAAIVRDAAAQGAFTPESEWVARFWEGKSKGWFLYWLAVGHNYMHMGHAGWVKEMILSKRGR